MGVRTHRAQAAQALRSAPATATPHRPPWTSRENTGFAAHLCSSPRVRHQRHTARHGRHRYPCRCPAHPQGGLHSRGERWTPAGGSSAISHPPPSCTVSGAGDCSGPAAAPVPSALAPPAAQGVPALDTVPSPPARSCKPVCTFLAPSGEPSPVNPHRATPAVPVGQAAAPVPAHPAPRWHRLRQRGEVRWQCLSSAVGLSVPPFPRRSQHSD